MNDIDVKEALTEEQQARLKAIENAVDILTKAEVPFILFGSVVHDLSKQGSGWWRYNKLSYNKDEKESIVLRTNAFQSFYFTCLEFLSAVMPNYGIGIFQDEKAIGAFHHGEYISFENEEPKEVIKPEVKA